jgi:hypothetical protein
LTIRDKLLVLIRFIGSFRNLNVEINKVTNLNSKLFELNNKLNASTIFYPDSQKIVMHLALLKVNVRDTLNVRIVQQLHEMILDELPWLLGSKDLDSDIQKGTVSQITALNHINLLIDSGIKRTSFLLDARRKEFENSILNLFTWIIVLITLSIIFLVFTGYHFYKERLRTKVKAAELETNEKRFRTLVSKSADIIAVFDKNTVSHLPESLQLSVFWDIVQKKIGMVLKWTMFIQKIKKVWHML